MRTSLFMNARGYGPGFAHVKRREKYPNESPGLYSMTSSGTFPVLTCGQPGLMSQVKAMRIDQRIYREYDEKGTE
jgi:hypothetical protein